LEAVDGCGLEEVGEKGRKRVFFKWKVEQANGARAFGTTTSNIRRMARKEGNKERKQLRSWNLFVYSCSIQSNADTVFSTRCANGYQTDTSPVDKGHKTHLEIKPHILPKKLFKTTRIPEYAYKVSCGSRLRFQVTTSTTRSIKRW